MEGGVNIKAKQSELVQVLRDNKDELNAHVVGSLSDEEFQALVQATNEIHDDIVLSAQKFRDKLYSDVMTTVITGENLLVSLELLKVAAKVREAISKSYSPVAGASMEELERYIAEAEYYRCLTLALAETEIGGGACV